MPGLIVPGWPQPERQVPVTQTTPVMVNGQLMAMRVEGTAEVVRGPLGRFIDLADQIEAEGLTVPSRIAEAIAAELEEGKTK